MLSFNSQKKRLIHHKFQALTFTELLIIIVAIAILATAALLFWPGKKIELRAQAHRIANDIRYVQSYAMSHNGTYRLSFSSTSVSLVTADGLTCIPHHSQSSCVIALESGITLSYSNLENGYLLFNSEGEPYVSSNTALTGVATITLSGSGETQQLIITPETGKVTVVS